MKNKNESGDTTQKTNEEMNKTDETKTYEQEKNEIRSGELNKKDAAEYKALMQEKLSGIKEGDSSFDISLYVNKKTTIEHVGIEEGMYGRMIKAETASLGSYETEEGEEKSIKGSVLFSVYLDEDGDMLYRPNSKLAKFLERHKLDVVGELIGCEVLTSIRVTDKGDFVTFV